MDNYNNKKHQHKQSLTNYTTEPTILRIKLVVYKPNCAKP